MKGNATALICFLKDLLTYSNVLQIIFNFTYSYFFPCILEINGRKIAKKWNFTPPIIGEEQQHKTTISDIDALSVHL